jgi:hypothetical protein
LVIDEEDVVLECQDVLSDGILLGAPIEASEASSTEQEKSEASRQVLSASPSPEEVSQVSSPLSASNQTSRYNQKNTLVAPESDAGCVLMAMV